MYVVNYTDTSFLWLLALIPVILSIIIYCCVRVFISRVAYKEDEEENDFAIASYNRLHLCASPLPPPSYFASHRDRLFRVHHLNEEKPQDYVVPPSYETAMDPENMPLDKVKEIIQDKRQKQRQQQQQRSNNQCLIDVN